MSKSFLWVLLLCFSTLYINAQLFFPTPVSNSENRHVGINQSSPNARLHISDDPASLECVPAIFVKSIIGEDAPGGGKYPGGPGGPESSTCSTPYVFRNITTDPSSSSAITYKLSPSGDAAFGDIFSHSATGLSRLSVED